MPRPSLFEPLPERTVALAALLVGLSVRLLLAFTTIGTNDVLFMLYFAQIVEKHGVLHAYSFGEFLNHPPLSMLLMSWYLRIADSTGLEYPQVVRAVQSLADVVTAAAIWRLAFPLARWAALAFLLSPAAAFISGFHCNTDPTLLALTVLAVLAATRGQNALSGALLAAAFGIKIVALFAVPLFFLAARRRRWAFAGGFTAVSALIFVPAAVVGGRAMVANVFGYGGWAGGWGLPGLARRAHYVLAPEARETWWLVLADGYARYGRYVLVAALVAFYVGFARWLRARDSAGLLVQGVPIVSLIVLALAPGFGMQYLVWPLPLLPFALTRTPYLITSALFSIYLFVVYTIWSGGLPWWFADATAEHPNKIIVTDAGFIVWAWVVVAAILALRRTVRSS